MTKETTPYFSVESGTCYRKIKGERVHRYGRDRAKALKEHYKWLANKEQDDSKTLHAAVKSFRKNVTSKQKQNEYVLCKPYRQEQERGLAQFDRCFGGMLPTEITVSQCKKFIEQIEEEQSLATAIKVRKLGKLLWKFMMAEGYCPLTMVNPMSLIDLDTLPGRKHYPDDNDYWAFFRYASLQLKIATLLARGTGLRLGDVVTKRCDEVTDEGVYNIQSKGRKYYERTGKEIKKQLFEHDAYTRLAWHLSQKQRKQLPSVYFLTNKFGKPFTAAGFSRSWARHMDRAVEKGIIKQKFTFHDHRRIINNEQATPEEGSKILGNTESVNRSNYWSNFERIKNKAAPQNPQDLTGVTGIEL